jgi:TetR/AcrR family transcriptional regulator
MRPRKAGASTASAAVPATSERLIAAARDIMIERNSTVFSLQEIAARSSINGALVKYHFGNKDGLLFAILENDAKAAVSELERLVSADMPASEKLTRHISGVIKTYSRKPYMNRLGHELLHERDEKMAAAVIKAYVEPVASLQRAILDQGVRAGEFNRVDPGFFYHAIGSACDALFRWHPEARRIWGVATIDDAQRRRYASFVAGLVLNGIVSG